MKEKFYLVKKGSDFLMRTACGRHKARWSKKRGAAYTLNKNAAEKIAAECGGEVEEI